MLKQLNTKRGGFTLVEIMIVVAIIALLASIAVPSFLCARKRSQATKMLQEVRIIDAAVDQYAIERSLGTGQTVSAQELVPYVKANSSLSLRLNSAGTSTSVGSGVTGITYTIPSVDGVAKVVGVDASYGSVLQPDFWSPYDHN